MGITTIYSCGPQADFGRIVDRLEGDLNIVWYPEISKTIHGNPIPVHPAMQIKMIPLLKGRRIVTMSEHIILAFMKKVRVRRMRADDLLLFCAGRRIVVDNDGNIDDWDGGFFHERAQLLF